MDYCRNCGSNIINLYCGNGTHYFKCETCGSAGQAHASVHVALRLWLQQNPPVAGVEPSPRFARIMKTALLDLFR